MTDNTPKDRELKENVCKAITGSFSQYGFYDNKADYIIDLCKQHHKNMAIEAVKAQRTEEDIYDEHWFYMDLALEDAIEAIKRKFSE